MYRIYLLPMILIFSAFSNLSSFAAYPHQEDAVKFAELTSGEFRYSVWAVRVKQPHDFFYTDWHARLDEYLGDDDSLTIPEWIDCEIPNHPDIYYVPVKGIGDEVFSGNRKIREVRMPSVTYLGERAFYDCSNLETFDPSSINSYGREALANCSALTVKNFETQLYSLGERAFMNTPIETIKFSDIDVDEDIVNAFISKSAFEGCSNLMTIDLSQVTKTVILEPGAFSGFRDDFSLLIWRWPFMPSQKVFEEYPDITLGLVAHGGYQPGNNTYTVDYPVKKLSVYSNLTAFDPTVTLYIKDGIENVRIFSDSGLRVVVSECSTLQKVISDTGVIYDGMFENFAGDSLSVYESDGLTYFGEVAFTGCKQLPLQIRLDFRDDEEQALMYSGTEASSTPFSGTPVREVELTGNVYLDGNVFGNLDKVLINNSRYPLMGNCTGSVTNFTIDRELGESSEGNTRIVIKTHGEDIIFPSQTRIPRGTLKKASFKKVRFGADVTYIGSDNLEQGCVNAQVIECNAIIPPTLELKSSDNLSAVVCVPAESVELYRTSQGWENFSDIRPLSPSGLGEVADGIADEPVEIYTLDGRRVAMGRETLASGISNPDSGMSALAPGIYIVRTASGKTSKIAIP